jgi:hypothetical protein
MMGPKCQIQVVHGSPGLNGQHLQADSTTNGYKNVFRRLAAIGLRVAGVCQRDCVSCPGA